MINVEAVAVDAEIYEIVVEGHSGFADKGEDIVCAAVSALTQIISRTMTTYYELPGIDVEISESDEDVIPRYKIVNNLLDFRIDFEDESTITRVRADTLMSTLLYGLYQIENTYPDFIKINLIEKKREDLGFDDGLI